MKLDYFRFRGASEEGRMAPVILVVGKAGHLRNLVIDEILGPILSPEQRAMNLVERDVSGKSAFDVMALLDDLRTPSLLGGARVVHLRGVGDLEGEDRSALEAYVAAPPSGSILLLEGESLPANTRLYKAVEKAGLVVQCRPLYGTPPPWKPAAGPEESELFRWISLRARDRKKRISTSAALAAIRIWGSDLAAIDGALDQTSTMVGAAPEIGEEEVLSLAPDSRADPIFRVVDRVLEGRTGPALAALRSISNEGLPDSSGRARDNPAGIAQILLRSLQSRLTAIWRARVLREQGKEDSEILKEVGIPPFLAGRFWGQVEANPKPTIPGRLETILRAEESIKRGRSEPMAAAETLVVRLGGSPR